MTDIYLEKMRSRLEAERVQLEEELHSHGHKSVTTGDWQGSSSESAPDADANIVADQIEELVSNVPIVEALEKRLHTVVRALEKIDEGTYGICEVGGEPIAPERLEANPSALTCIEHSEEQ
jgi:RNA polymerase-binding transcription factor DksA